MVNAPGKILLLVQHYSLRKNRCLSFLTGWGGGLVPAFRWGDSNSKENQGPVNETPLTIAEMGGDKSAFPTCEDARVA